MFVYGDEAGSIVLVLLWKMEENGILGICFAWFLIV